MSALREQDLELAAGYAMGVLDEADRLRFEALLAQGHPELAEALRDFSEAGVMLAHAATPAVPSDALRSRVLAAVRAERATTPTRQAAAAPPAGRVIALPSRSRHWAFTWAPLAAAAGLAVVSAVNWNAAQKLRSELVGARGEITSLQRSLAEERAWADVLNASSAEVVEFGLTPDGVAALKARATFDKESRKAVLVFANFTPPAGHDYELWAIRPEGPASLGVIRADEQGHAVVRLSDVGDPAALGAFAVSLEAAGGSPNPKAPSGPVVMVGKVAG